MRAEKRLRFFLLAVIFCLVAVLITLSVALGIKNDGYKKAKSDVNSYRSQLADAREENEQLKTEIDAEKEKNSKLESSIAVLAANKDSKVCYLTFDDGPSDNTLLILDILKNYDAKATFFVVGTAKLDYLDEIHSAGHTVGLHTDTHIFEQIYSSDDAYFADLNAISQKVEQRIGVKSMCVRFPGGGSNVKSKKINQGIMTRLSQKLPTLGYTYFDWNVDSGDAGGKNVDPNVICGNVLNQATGKNSICVLMHDTSAKSTTVQALPAILEGLRAMGYKFEVLKVGGEGYHHAVNN